MTYVVDLRYALLPSVEVVVHNVRVLCRELVDEHEPVPDGLDAVRLAEPWSQSSASGVGSPRGDQMPLLNVEVLPSRILFDFVVGDVGPFNRLREPSISFFCPAVRGPVYRLTWYTTSRPEPSTLRSRMSMPPSPFDGVIRVEYGCSRLISIATTASTSLPSSRVHSMRVIRTSLPIEAAEAP
jgi:hypothetical protein